MLKAERIALIALDRRLAELQATSRTAFFNAIAVTHEAVWPPAPFEQPGLEWAVTHLAQDPEGEGWYGWAIIASEGERLPPRLVGLAALIGRPEDDTGDVEFAFGLLPEFQGRGFGGETIRALAGWAFANGAKRVISHLDAEDAHAATALARQGFTDTNEPPFPGVARWALSAAA